MQGFYCSNCNTTYASRQPEDICPRCPHEPLLDLSTAEGQRLAYHFEDEERLAGFEKIERRARHIGVVGGMLLFPVMFGLVAWLTEPRGYSRGGGGDIWFIMIAPALAIAEITRRLLTRWYLRKKTSGLPPPPPDHGPA